MQTKREYLVGLGLAKPGRGKFSNDAKKALAEAEAKGIKFSDIVTKIPTGKSEPTGNATEKSAGGQIDPRDTAWLSPSDYRFPEAEYRGITFRDGKRVEVSLRECCNLCRVSLVNHMCDNPTILGDIVVKIEKR